MKHFDELHKACSQVRIFWMGRILKRSKGIVLKHVVELRRAGLHVRRATMGIILKHFHELHRAHSLVKIDPIGIILKHFDKRYRACPYISTEQAFMS